MNLKSAGIAVFFISLLGLMLYRAYYKIPAISPEDVTEEMIGKEVIVSGVVTSISSGDTTFMKLNSLPVVFFSNVTAKEGEMLRVYGRVSKYRGKLEIIGKRIIR